MLRSMTILVPVEISIVYSITVTLRQVLGWIFLHEEFIGNNIIAHILALLGLLSLARNDAFRFSRFLLGLTMVVLAVIAKKSFDVLNDGFVKDLKSDKYRIVMINVSLCGIFLFWLLPLLLHITQHERIQFPQLFSVMTGAMLLSAFVLNLLLIIIPMKYTSLSNVAALLLVIPSTAIMDYYLLQTSYSPLVIYALLSSCAGRLLSMVPKQWFQPGEAANMKQALGLLNKDPSMGAAANLLGPGAATTRTFSAFEERRAQRLIRNALLYNEVKT